MSLAMDAEGFSPRGTVEGSVAGHPAILGGLSSDPVASHLLGIQTCSPYCIGHDFNGRCSNGQCDSGLLLGSSDGCCETPGGLVCGSFFVLAPSRIRVGYTGTSRFGEGNGVQIFDRRFGILPSHFIFIAELSSPNFHHSHISALPISIRVSIVRGADTSLPPEGTGSGPSHI